jgi:hypothetical protein
MPGDAPDPVTVASRRSLLDSLQVLGPHIGRIVLVGAHAIYLHTEDVITGVALFTKDVDLALIPPLDESPDIDGLMRGARFEEGDQPGIWRHAGSQVDLLVPEALAAPAGRRAARLPGHGRATARKVTGIEGAAVDHETRTIAALEPTDRRTARLKVAGPGALLISKAFKLAERDAEPGQARLLDKDAFDAYRLLQLPTAILSSGIRRMLDDPRTGAMAEAGIEHVRELFGAADSLGNSLAGRYVAGVGEPETVRLATAALAQELLTDLRT